MAEVTLEAVLVEVRRLADLLVASAARWDKALVELGGKLDQALAWQAEHDRRARETEDPPEPAPVSPIPLRRRAPTPPPAGASEALEAAVHAVEVTRYTPPVVLLVEDEQEWLEAYAERLRDKAFLLTARSLEEAVAHLRGIQPTLVILDLVLDGSSGIDVLRYLREQVPGGRLVRVLVISAAVDAAIERTIKRINGGGPLDFLDKPRARAELEQVLANGNGHDVDVDDETDETG